MVTSVDVAPDRIPAIDMFDPMRPQVLTDPFPAYALLREHHPVAFLEPLDVWAVSRYADVRAVLGAPEAFSAALAFGKDSLIRDVRAPGERELNLRFAGDLGAVVTSSDGEVHARLRRMIARLLSKPQLDSAEAAIRERVVDIVTAIAADRDEFDVINDLAKPVAARAIGTVMGLSDVVITTLTGWADLTFRALDPSDDLSRVSAGPHMMFSNLASVRVVTAFLNTAVGRSAGGAPNGLVEAWRDATTAAAREEVVLSVLHLFQAGYETIVSAIGAILERFLIDQPGSLLLSADAATFTSLIEEGVRLACPVRATLRTTVGPQVVGDVAVPAGALVLVLLGSANRDESVFPEPDEVRLGRPAAHLAFGWGPHRCLGRVMAHMELTHILGTLMSTTRSIHAADGARLSANILKAGYDRLPVRVEWRRSTA